MRLKLPPAAKPTRLRTGRAGYACPHAVAPAARPAAPAARDRNRRRERIMACASGALDEAQLASEHVLDRDGSEVHAFQAAHVHRPDADAVARPAEGQDPAHGAEIILRDLRIPLVH